MSLLPAGPAENCDPALVQPAGFEHSGRDHRRAGEDKHTGKAGLWTRVAASSD
jgi:tRNA(Leu) C34 or U34 (ribose-2'-O)-methylase TrmL